MKTLVVVAHPNPASFNKSGILETVKETLLAKNHEVIVRDLYALNFNPILSGADFESFQKGEMPQDIKTEQDHISWANNIILVYPVWWIGRPAIMQGYFDRVMAFNFAFTVDEKGARGLLTLDKGLIINTTGTPEFVYDAWPDSKQLISRPATEGVLGYCGVKKVNQVTYFGIVNSTADERTKILDDVKNVLADF